MSREPSTTASGSFTVVGGLAQSLINFRGPLLLSLQRAGFTVKTMAGEPDERTLGRLRAMGVTFQPIPLQRTSKNPFHDIIAVRSLAKTFRAERPQAILAYTIKPVILGLVAARLAGVKHRFALISGLGYGLTGESFGRKVLSAVLRRAYRFALSGARVVFFQNPDDEALFRSSVLPATTRTEIVRGSGVDIKHFDAQPFPPSEVFRFLFLGRYTVEKGVRELADATRALRQTGCPAFEVHLVGWRDSNPACVSQKEFDGWLAEGLIVDEGRLDDVRPMIAACHALVLPSYREGTPRSVLEAMSMARPIVTTDAPGCRETTIDGETGFLVQPRDATDLARAMRAMIENPAMAQAFGEQARNRVVELYEAGAVADHMVKACLSTMRLT